MALVISAVVYDKLHITFSRHVCPCQEGEHIEQGGTRRWFVFMAGCGVLGMSAKSSVDPPNTEFYF
jgi:hypothetical protein